MGQVETEKLNPTVVIRKIVLINMEVAFFTRRCKSKVVPAIITLKWFLVLELLSKFSNSYTF